MRCKTCHYSLENLTEHRCPECGNPFDPNDPATFDERPQILTLRWMLHIAIACYVFNLALMTYISLTELPGELGQLLVVPVAAAAALIFTFPIGLILYGTLWIIRNLFRSTE